jgi:hypothetical protein
LYERRGSRMYGSEPVSQVEHALQCAMHAAEGGAGMIWQRSPDASRQICGISPPSCGWPGLLPGK